MYFIIVNFYLFIILCILLIILKFWSIIYVFY